MDACDAAIVGAGPNGLAAAITLARARKSVVVLEAASHAGGGLRSEALTLDGFVHDVCSSVYPLGIASPFFQSLVPLGIEWVHPPIAVAHPLDDGDAVWMSRSLRDTAAALDVDGKAYRALFAPFVEQAPDLVREVLAPVHIPRHLGVLLRFGVNGLRSVIELATSRFSADRTRALFAGLGAHSTLELSAPLSASFGLLLGALAHASGWPFVTGGASKLADALVAHLTALGGRLVLDSRVEALDELAGTPTVLCDVTPRQFVRLAGARLSSSYRHTLERYRYGPGVCKVDWALSAPIPWRASVCRSAGTVHVGGSMEEIAEAERAACRRQVTERPFVIVTQPTTCDSSRAPSGCHVAWGYCHVPHGSAADMTDRIEAQIERFAPGFRDAILARHTMVPADLERRNANLIGGDISGGTMSIPQMIARPTWRGYRTALSGIYLCSSSTLPGGGVHGMCGYHAAQAALHDLRA